MGRKIPSLITGINVDRATFHNAQVEKLSFINFFYGNNGAGKSSIAYAIDEDEGVTWADGRSRDDYDVLVYNRDFVDENFSSYGNLKGVFIVNKINKEVQAQIDAKTEEKKNWMKSLQQHRMSGIKSQMRRLHCFLHSRMNVGIRPRI